MAISNGPNYVDDATVEIHGKLGSLEISRVMGKFDKGIFIDIVAMPRLKAKPCCCGYHERTIQ